MISDRTEGVGWEGQNSSTERPGNNGEDSNRLPKELPARGWGWREVSAVVRSSWVREGGSGQDWRESGRFPPERRARGAGEGRRGPEELVFPQCPSPGITKPWFPFRKFE